MALTNAEKQKRHRARLKAKKNTAVAPGAAKPSVQRKPPPAAPVAAVAKPKPKPLAPAGAAAETMTGGVWDRLEGGLPSRRDWEPAPKRRFEDD